MSKWGPKLLISGCMLTNVITDVSKVVVDVLGWYMVDAYACC